MRAVIYARYSSDLQSEASIEDQLRVCRARADKEGWQVVEVFTDHAISGATTLRPGYQALLSALRIGGIDIVLAESLDRFSRDQEHIAAFYKQATYAGARIVTLAEGDISELHIGLKGTMGALYLKDLAQKTHRGIEGRIRKGRAIGHVSYGYRLLRQVGGDGEFERGLREIDQDKARIVERIFRAYAAGLSPRRIARELNQEGIPGPGGGLWHEATIRGRSGRGDGMLRNAIYAGRLVWNRHSNVKDPVTGSVLRRANGRDAVVEQELPQLRIIDPDLWKQVQTRLTAEAAPRGPQPQHRFWERRRPKFLLTGKLVCGCCGATFATRGQDYLGCRAAFVGTCQHDRRYRRSVLEDHVLDVLSRRMMAPELVQEFVATFAAEWNRIVAEDAAGRAGQERELQLIERKIANLLDAVADGIRAPGLQARLDELEAKRASLTAALAGVPAQRPALHPNLAQLYRERVLSLSRSLAGPDGAEALEAARTLIDRIIVSPPDDGGGLPNFEVVGELVSMFGIAGLAPQSKGLSRKRRSGSCLVRQFS